MVTFPLFLLKLHLQSLVKAKTCKQTTQNRKVTNYSCNFSVLAKPSFLTACQDFKHHMKLKLQCIALQVLSTIKARKGYVIKSQVHVFTNVKTRKLVAI